MGRAVFSLLEMMIVLALILITSVISVVNLVPVMQSQHVTNAYNTTLSTLPARHGRQRSVAADRVLGDVFKRSHTQHDHGGADADGIVDISGRSEKRRSTPCRRM